MKNTTVKLIADYVRGNDNIEKRFDGLVEEGFAKLNVAFSVGDFKEIELSVGEFAVALVGSLVIEGFVSEDDYSDLRARLQLGTYHWFKDLSYLESFVGETNVGKFVEKYVNEYPKKVK